MLLTQEQFDALPVLAQEIINHDYELADTCADPVVDLTWFRDAKTRRRELTIAAQNAFTRRIGQPRPHVGASAYVRG